MALPKTKLSIIIVASLLLSRGSIAIDCNFLAPIKSFGPLFGLVMVPGGKIEGDSYKELTQNIQQAFPARLWIGLGTEFPLDLPSANQLSQVMEKCFQKAAEEHGSETQEIFLAGHSLGGSAAATFLFDHPSMASGLILFSSYLSDSIFDNIESFPIPTIHICGELDGQVLTLMPQKYLQCQVAENIYPEKFPVVIVRGANHHQVASDENPDDRDIISEISEEEAHIRYAETAVNFMVKILSKYFQNKIFQTFLVNFEENRRESEVFLKPFLEARILEGTDTTESPWALIAQIILAGGGNLSGLQLQNIVNSPHSLIYNQPQLMLIGKCKANLTTHTCNLYEQTALGISLESAQTMKAKLKLGNAVRESVCLAPNEMKQAKNVNEEAFKWAFNHASDVAKERFMRRGRKLKFVNDKTLPDAPTFLMTKLEFLPTSDPMSFNVLSATRITDAGNTEFDNNHYMNLLSPYRALEWIYIIALRREFVP